MQQVLPGSCKRTVVRVQLWSEPGKHMVARSAGAVRPPHTQACPDTAGCCPVPADAGFARMQPGTARHGLCPVRLLLSPPAGGAVPYRPGPDRARCPAGREQQSAVPCRTAAPGRRNCALIYHFWRCCKLCLTAAENFASFRPAGAPGRLWYTQMFRESGFSLHPAGRSGLS